MGSYIENSSVLAQWFSSETWFLPVRTKHIQIIYIFYTLKQTLIKPPLRKKIICKYVLRKPLKVSDQIFSIDNILNKFIRVDDFCHCHLILYVVEFAIAHRSTDKYNQIPNTRSVRLKFITRSARWAWPSHGDNEEFSYDHF